MGALRQLAKWRTTKARRGLVNRLKDSFELLEVEWRPEPDSPLRHGETTVRLPLDGIIGPRTLAYAHWHDEHSALIRARLASHPETKYFLIDVGANIGLVTRQLIAPDPTRWTGAICFEPERRNLRNLRWNLEPLHNVHVEPFAISDKDAPGLLHVDLGNAGDCSLDVLPGSIQREGVEIQPITLISGQSAFQKISQARLAGDRVVWKSDTQGHDLTIMAAMPDELWEATDVAMIEVRSTTAPDHAIDKLLKIAASFEHRKAVKRGERPISLQELESFCRRRSESEFDLLLHR